MRLRHFVQALRFAGVHGTAWRTILALRTPLTLRAALALCAALAPCTIPAARADDVTVTILYPSGPQQSSVYVRATVVSVFSVATVTATAEDRSVSLVFNPDLAVFAWEGQLSLAGLAYGAKTLTVAAQDIHGTPGSATRGFDYDPPPTVEILDPIEATVARTSVRVRARGHDNGPTTVAVRLSIGPAVVSGNDSVDTVHDFGTYAGMQVFLTYRVTDALGQFSEAVRSIYVDSTSGLDEVETAPGAILAIDSSRILFSADAETRQLAIVARGTGVTTTIPIPSDREALPDRAFLTPRGAIFLSRLIGGNSLTHRVFEWDGASLVERATPNSPSFLKAAGSYALWSEGSRLVRANTATGSQIDISTNAINTDNDITPEGSVAFVDYAGYVVKVRDATGVTTRGDGLRPFLSGPTAVYEKRSRAPNGIDWVYGIAMHDGVQEILLSSTGSTEPEAARHYQVNNGWVVYGRRLVSGIDALFLRSPTGENRQLPSDPTPYLAALAPNGDVAYWSQDLTFANGQAQVQASISPVLGRVLWLDGQWRYIIGRSLYAIHDLVTSVGLQDLAAVVLDPGVQLSWRVGIDAADAAGIVVERAESAAGPWETCSPLLPLQPEMEFLDTPAMSSRDLWYRVVLVATNGDENVLGSIRVAVGPGVLRSTQLDPPHVANDRRTVAIGYSIAGAATSVDVEIFDVRGRRVFGFEPARRSAGAYVSTWRRIDAGGRPVPSGIYFVRLVTETARATRKVLLLAPR